MDVENIIREAKEAAALKGAKKTKAQAALQFKILEYFSRGGADLTLDEVISLSRATNGMRTSSEPRSI